MTHGAQAVEEERGVDGLCGELGLMVGLSRVEREHFVHRSSRAEFVFPSLLVEMFERVNELETWRVRSGGGREGCKERGERAGGSGLQHKTARGDDDEAADGGFAWAQNEEDGCVEMAREGEGSGAGIGRVRAQSPLRRLRRHLAPLGVRRTGETRGSPWYGVGAADGEGAAARHPQHRKQLGDNTHEQGVVAGDDEVPVQMRGFPVSR